MPNNDTTHALLIDAAQEAWDDLALDIMVRLYGTMPHRVKQL